MKRSQMLIKLTRLYHIRHCMVEARHITADQFMEEVLSLVEEFGMKPPQREVVVTDECDIRKLRYIDYDDSWEPERE